MSFSSDLRKARTRRGLSQNDLSRQIKIAFQDEGGATLCAKTIQALENDPTQTPRDTTLEKLAKVLPELSRYIPK